MDSNITKDSPLNDKQKTAIAAATPGGISHTSSVKVTPEVHHPYDAAVQATIKSLEAKRDDWFKRFSNKPNYNPSFSVNQLITPIITELHKNGATITPHINNQISSIPSDPPQVHFS